MASDTNKWGWVTDTHVTIAVAVGGAVLALLLLIVGLGHDLSVGDKPAKPKVVKVNAAKLSQELDRSPDAWRSYLEKDAETFGVATPSVADMAAAFRYRMDREERVLAPGDSFEAVGLRLSVTTQDMRGSHRKQLVLQIESLADKPMAYRVTTSMRPNVTQACHQKEDLSHNAIAIAAGDLQLRSECVYRSGWKLAVEKVETMELSELSYRYVSMVFPPELAIERRVSQGHKRPAGEECRVILPAEVKRALQTGETTWRDLVDFYARHSCKTYTFPPGYKAFEQDDERPLPAAGARP